MAPKITNAAAVLIVVSLALVIFTNSMTKPLDRNEQMYCTGGVLLAQGKMIYRDFSYVGQMPYHPLLCAALFKALNTTHYLLAGRILSCVCNILIVVCIIGIYRRIFNAFPVAGLFLGLAAAILYVFNPVVDYATGFAWNYDLVSLCVVLSFWLFISTDFKRKSKYRSIALIGALLTLATCMRITTALVQILFFIMLLTRPAESIKQRFKNIMPFLIASAILLIWPLWTLILAPQAFFLNIFRMPVLHMALLYKVGVFWGKFELILLSFAIPGGILLVLITAYLCVMLIWNRHKLTISSLTNLLLAILLLLALSIIALTPPAVRVQHLAMPVPFIIISFAFPLIYLRRLGDSAGPGKHFRITSAVIVACVFVAVAARPIVLLRIPKLFRPQTWVPVQVHKISRDIDAKTKDPKLILTLAPLYALEGGCNIYTELSAGPVWYRIADAMSPSELKTINTVGPKTVRKLFEKFPPSAVVLGVEPRFLEEPLQKAVKPDWDKFVYDTDIWERKAYDDGIVVYFRR